MHGVGRAAEVSVTLTHVCILHEYSLTNSQEDLDDEPFMSYDDESYVGLRHSACHGVARACCGLVIHLS